MYTPAAAIGLIGGGATVRPAVMRSCLFSPVNRQLMGGVHGDSGIRSAQGSNEKENGWSKSGDGHDFDSTSERPDNVPAGVNAGCFLAPHFAAS